MVTINKHAKIIFSWVGIISGGIYLFFLAKESIDNKRYENMKIRQRMKTDIFVEDVKEE